MKNFSTFSFFTLSFFCFSHLVAMDKEKLVEVSKPKKITSPHKKNLECRNGGGLTQLHLAASRFRLKKVISLLDQGANINARVKLDDVDVLYKGFTPLHFAVQFVVGEKDEKTIWELLRRGADYTIADSDEKSAIDKATTYETIQIMSKVESYAGLLFFDLEEKNYTNVENHIKSIMNDKMDLSFILKHFKIKDKQEVKTFFDFSKNTIQLIELLEKGAQVEIDLQRFSD